MNTLYEDFQTSLHGIWARRWIALAVAWAICMAGWIAVALIPNVYESYARVFVQTQSMLPDKMGLTDLEQVKAIDEVRQTMTSSSNLEKVVRQTDMALRVTSDRDLTAAIGMLKENIKVVSQQDNVFNITTSWSDRTLSPSQNAKLAAQVTQKLIDVFQEAGALDGVAEANKSLQFLDAQIASRAKDLQAAEQRRVDFEQRNFGSLPGGGSITTRIQAARAEIVQIDSQLIAAQSALAGINGQLAGTPAEIVGVGPSGGPTALSQAQADLAAAQSRGWTDSHPDVISLKRQIAQLRASGLGSGGGGGTRTPNPAYISLRSMQAERASTVGALQSRKGALQGEINSLTAKQVQEPGLAAEQDRLNRDYNVIKDQYDKLLGDREDVRLRGDVQAQAGNVQFRVVDPPSSSVIPAKPNRPLLVIGVLLAGIVAGLAAAFALTHVRATFSTASKLERATGLPVIGAITEIRTPVRNARVKQQMRWFYAGSGGLVGMCVLLLAVEFIQRGMAS
jgi:polysaccharide biosynthesis transport protein